MVLSKPAHAERDFPSLDDHLVEPGTPYEMYDGELVHVSPAKPPHADRHATVTGLLLAHVRSTFRVAIDLLTRVSWTSEIAPDVSVRPRGRDRTTGARKLEELAFEIVSTQTARNAGRKAAMLVERGVRRVFAIHLQRRCLLEWSLSAGTWQAIPLRSCIDDPVLQVPLPVKLLVRAASPASIDDALAQALVLKNNAVIEARVAQGVREAERKAEREGERKGFAKALLLVLVGRGIRLDARDRERIRNERNVRQIERWLATALHATGIADVFADRSRRMRRSRQRVAGRCRLSR